RAWAPALDGVSTVSLMNAGSHNARRPRTRGACETRVGPLVKVMTRQNLRNVADGVQIGLPRSQSVEEQVPVRRHGVLRVIGIATLLVGTSCCSPGFRSAPVSAPTSTASSIAPSVPTTGGSPGASKRTPATSPNVYAYAGANMLSSAVAAAKAYVYVPS